MTLEQLQDKLLPILFDDNDKFEDVNRANIVYNRITDQIAIKRTKFDKTRCSDPDISTLKCLLDVLKLIATDFLINALKIKIVLG